jgi:hypothetical protein
MPSTMSIPILTAVLGLAAAPAAVAAPDAIREGGGLPTRRLTLELARGTGAVQ